MGRAGKILDPRMLELLVDPRSHAPLRLAPAGDRLLCADSGRAYPVRRGIPVLLAEEAEPVPEKKGAS